MRRLWVFFVFCSICWSADLSPATEAENLLGKKGVLPEALKGHVTVIVTGFTHKSQIQTKQWTDHLKTEMIEAYSIAVLQEVPELVRGMAVAGIKSGTPQTERDHFLLAFHGEKELKDAAHFDSPDDAYLALVDGEGRVRWRFHGAWSESALAQLKA